MSTDASNTKQDSRALDEAVEALLGEIDAVCTRFENPSMDEDDDGAGAVGDSGNRDAEDAAEAALQSSSAAADGLLEQAADQLIETLEQEIGHASGASAQDDGAGRVAGGGADVEDDDLLNAALDTLLSENTEEEQGGSGSGVLAGMPGAGGAGGTNDGSQESSEPNNAAAYGADETETDHGASPLDAFADLDGALDALLDGTFEAADGQAVDTAGVDTTPDPALMLDRSAGEDAPEADGEAPDEDAESEDPPAAAIPAAKPVAAQAAGVVEPERAAPVVAGLTVPGVTATAQANVTEHAPGFKDRVLGFVSRVWAWGRPRMVVAGGSAVVVLKPVAARALMMLSKPLESKPARVRDSIGWVAIWTLFLAVCVWMTVLLRSPHTPSAGEDATAVVTAEPAAD